MSGAFEKLLWHYQHRSAEALAQHKAGMPVVAFTSSMVPWELIRAAGCFPVLIGPDLDVLDKPTPLADSLMEPVFDSRIRAIFNDVLSGAWSFLRLLIVPRTSEPENKLYLYLREVTRQKLCDKQPPVHLYDLLHTRSSISRKYGIDRTKDLMQRLEGIAPISSKSLASAITESNAARAALRRLQKLRQGEVPRITGSNAHMITGALYFMNRAEYAKLVGEVCRECKSAKPLRGPRLLIKGMPLHHPRLHQALEAHGAVIVAEDDWWGSRAVEANVVPGRGVASIISAIFENYYLHTPSPRVLPAAAADRWFQDSVRRRIDGVVFYLPPEDDVYGWDYPRQRDFLQTSEIPSLLIREDAFCGLSAGANAQIRDFIQKIRRSRHAARV
ncbi:MAG TPA: 2-hydroxyacyl-CoA dehydratase family protein [Candidatus Acidoferrales bacterium]|nr:2-hydroxyacyl-CoA dehydratase family protein [Candidatus Acidoferrales bacterium]